MDKYRHFVIGISGASGIILGFKVVQALLCHAQEENAYVHLVMTKDARYTALEELQKAYPNDASVLKEFSEESRNRVSLYGIRDFGAPIASGTFTTQGMAIVPCSMASLAAIATGISDNLLRRAADVTLKERRRLVVVPREAPFSSIHLQHMLTLSNMGASIIAPQPAWYTHPKTIEDVEDHIVGRILDSLGVHINYARWQGSKIVDSKKSGEVLTVS